MIGDGYMCASSISQSDSDEQKVIVEELGILDFVKSLLLKELQQKL